MIDWESGANRSLFITKPYVWNALAVRALMARYGHGNFGFLWLILEPLLLISGVAIVWSNIYGHSRHGLLIVPFVLTGYTMLTLWRHIVGHSTRLIQRHSDLLYHQRITPADIVISTYFVEITGILVSFFVAYIVALILNFTDPVEDFLILILAWFLTSFFYAGVGLIVSGITEISEVAERFIQPIMYLTIPISGAFTLVSWMPRSFQDFLLYIPMVHGTEMFRSGYYGEAVPTQWDPWYLLICGLLANVIGLILFSRAMLHLEQ